MRTLTAFTIILGLLAGAALAQKKLALKDLPAEAQKTIQAELKGAEIKSIDKEVEKGVTQYEVESVLNGKHRDFNVDAKGKLLVVEEEVDINGIPAAAKAAIEKRVGGGKLRMVETVTEGNGAAMYEAAFTTKAGKKASILVKADGTETKN
jgi:uncharacterized membrane protein YkoI